MSEAKKDYGRHYSGPRLIATVERFLSSAGRDVISQVIQAYYLSRATHLPLWAKASVIAALGYFILTPDAIPDVMPVVGFVDDMAVLSSTLAGLATYLTPEIRERAKERLQTLWRRQSVGDAL